jgi:hypothetical protein
MLLQTAVNVSCRAGQSCRWADGDELHVATCAVSNMSADFSQVLDDCRCPETSGTYFVFEAHQVRLQFSLDSWQWDLYNTELSAASCIQALRRSSDVAEATQDSHIAVALLHTGLG